jgi:hypothetical protein
MGNGSKTARCRPAPTSPKSLKCELEPLIGSQRPLERGANMSEESDESCALKDALAEREDAIDWCGPEPSMDNIMHALRAIGTFARIQGRPAKAVPEIERVLSVHRLILSVDDTFSLADAAAILAHRHNLSSKGPDGPFFALMAIVFPELPKNRAYAYARVLFKLNRLDLDHAETMIRNYGGFDKMSRIPTRRKVAGPATKFTKHTPRSAGNRKSSGPTRSGKPRGIRSPT